jgi:hypothetical protein
MDTEEEIDNAAEKIMRDRTVSKLNALNMLLGRSKPNNRKVMGNLLAFSI